MTQRRFKLSGNWRLMFADMNLDGQALLRLANAPEDLWSRDVPLVTSREWFDLWRALEVLLPEERAPLMLGQFIDAAGFDPPMFAALCSPDMKTAVERLSHYKALIAPMKLDIEREETQMTLTLHAPELATLPTFLGRGELVFFVSLVRTATRHHVVPLCITSPVPLTEAREDYEAWFGCPVHHGETWSLSMSMEDMLRPFLTANHQMFEFFEPELRQRLSEVESQASTVTRVEASLRELLPSGRCSIEDVARSLGLSKRSLQRALRRESTTFRHVLEGTREKLARHYLGHSQMASAEISFLLGYDDPNSFFRAFRSWTGTTPESLRA